MIKKKSLLCVGLDSDYNKIPNVLKTEFQTKAKALLEFNKRIIEHTHSHAIAYKINTAFYESLGHEGWKIMEKTIQFIPKDCFTIADAKRADIGNTSKMYAKAFFETLTFDALTLNPYLGNDSLSPYLEYKNKWLVVLGLTSNSGTESTQLIPLKNDMKMFEQVITSTSTMGSENNMMYVVGATQKKYFKLIRNIVPYHFLLIPGVGFQGGNIEDLKPLCSNNFPNLIINVSRGIIYPDTREYYFHAVKEKAKHFQQKTLKLFS